MWSGVKRVVLWDYRRGSWQYDIMVAAVILFVFATPRSWFHDQPRVPLSHEVALLPSPHGSSVFWIEPALISAIPQGAQKEVLNGKVREIIQQKTGRAQSIERVDRVYDSDNELVGYMAVAKP